MSRLRGAGRRLGGLWLALSIATGGLAGPAAASHDAMHEHEAVAVQGHPAHHQAQDARSGSHAAGADEACQPDLLCMAGCAHATSALPPLRLSAPALRRPTAAANPTDDAFRSRAPERELRPPILPLNG